MTAVAEPLELPLAAWPDNERLTWERALRPIRSPHQNRGVRNRYSILSWQKSYGRWLAFLRDTSTLDLGVPPSARVTPQQLDDYIAHLQACGNRPVTIVSRVAGLKQTLDLLEPSGDHRWITRPRGIPIQQYFDMEPRLRPVQHSADLLAWAEKLFVDGLAHHKPRCRRALVRDAAMIGILVMPAPRLGALSQFRLSRNLQHRHDGWCVNQDAGITKMKKAEWSPLLPDVQPMLERYLRVERVELLDGGTSDRLWIAQGGGGLTAGGITTRLCKLSSQHFETIVRAHAFRRSLATTLAVDGADAPLDASTLLGHSSPTTTQRHYNKAKAFTAGDRHAERLERMLYQAELDARMGFQD